jgi:hypothetical protein
VKSALNFGTQLWQEVPTWKVQETSAPKFGEWFQQGKATKLRHQSLVMDGILNGKNSTLARKWLQSAKEFGTMKVRCRIFEMF